MIKILIFIAVVIGAALAAFGILATYKALNIKKEYRFKHHKHLVFLSVDVAIGVLVYFGTWIVSLLSEKAAAFFESIYTTHLIPSLVLSVFLLYKSIYKIYFHIYSKKSTDISENNLPVQYYEKDGAFYLSPYYSTLAKVFKFATIIVVALISIGIGIIYLINESCLLQSFSDIIVPIVNIMFTASKRMMFVCDSQSTVKQCEKWFEELDIKSNTANSNIVIDVLNYDNTESIKMDSNVDIYIGTVDLALNSKAIFENIDGVFCLNIDKIISESALNLNLLASVLSSDRYDNVQYVLFGNRVNGLKQTASQVFMRNNFGYQVVNSSIEKSLSANFWSTEKGWLQSAILPGFAAQYLGQLIPLAIPAFKFDIRHADIISASQSFSDQMLSLQTAQPLLKKYMDKDILNIDEAITFAENENFLTLNDNSVVVVGDTRRKKEK